MKLRPLLIAAVFPVLAAPPAVMAQAPQERLPDDPQVITGTLSNGLRYYVRENQRPEKRAELRLVVNAGSILEDDAQQGLAHFVEHMAFNGTRSFEKQQIVNYLESIGMRFGADVNAYTSFDETVYMLTVPTDTGTALETGLHILEEWAHAVAFDPGEIDKERGVVVEEWRLGLGAGERLRQQYFPVLFQGSRYADRLPIGKREVLESFAHEEAIRFYREWYRPDLMAVIAVGDFDGRAVERMIHERFGAIAPSTATHERPSFPVPDHAETLIAIATDPEATGTVVEVDWKLPRRPAGTVAAMRESLIRSLYSRMLNARLAELTQKADPPFIGAGSSYGGLVRTRDMYSLGAAVQDGGIERGLEAILTEAERVARHGFTATELDRQKTNLLRAYERAYAERDKTESSAYAGEYVAAFLEDRPIPGIAFEYGQAQRLLPGIAIDEVNALARQWMSDRSRAVIVTAPRKPDGSLPEEDALLEVFDRVARADVAPYDDVVADAPLIAELPPPGPVTDRERIEALDTEVITLANGIRVYLKRTDFQDDQVLFGAWSPGGLSLIGDAEYGSAVFASTLVSISGLGDLDQVQLGKALTGKAARVSFGIGEHSEGINASASPRDLETMLQLVHLHFTGPRHDTVAVASYRQRLAAALANRAASPEVAMQDTMSVTRWQYHPRARPIGPDLVEAMDPELAFRVYRERFADPGDFTYVMVGAFDDDDVALLEKYLGSLPVRGSTEQPRDNGMRPASGVIEKVVRRGVEPKGQTHIVFAGAAEYTRENRLHLALLADVLEMRLRDVLREDLGGTYGVGIGQSVSRVPVPGYSFEIQFGAAPERLEELVATVFAEIERIRTEGPAADALANAKEQRRRAWETNLRRNEYWMSVLLSEAETGEPAAGALELPRRLEAVTAEHIRAAAERFLDPAAYVRVSLLPER